jgi:hypothetical protein
MSSPTKEEAVKVLTPILQKEGIYEMLGINDVKEGNINMEKFVGQFYGRCQGNMSKCISYMQLAIAKFGKEGILSRLGGEMSTSGMSTSGMSTSGLSTSGLSTSGLSISEICSVTRCCQEIVVELIESKNPKLGEIRNKFYILLAHGVNPEEIIKRIFKIVIDNMPGYETEIAEITDDIDFQLLRASREFYHLENYVLRLLVIIKVHQNKPEVTKKKPKLTIKKIVKPLSEPTAPVPAEPEQTAPEPVLSSEELEPKSKPIVKKMTLNLVKKNL